MIINHKSFNRILIAILLLVIVIVLNSCVKPNDSTNPFGTITPEQQSVVINEINPHGTDWIELYNKSDQPVNISNFTLVDDGSGHIPLVIRENTMIMPHGFMIFDSLPFGISGSSADGVIFKDAAGLLLDQFSYAAGSITSGTTVGRIPDGGTNWVYNLNPTKGYSNDTTHAPPIDTTQKLFINEFLATSATGQADWIEIYNADSLHSYDLTGYVLRDSLTTPSSWTIPSGFVIAPKGYIAFTNTINFPFGLSSTSDGIKFFDSTGKLIDSYFYNTAQIQDRTTGRLPDGGTWTPNLPPTKGTSNHP